MEYKKTFLDKIIIRADFLDPSPIGDKSSEECPEELAKQLRRKGPVTSREQMIASGFKITANGIETPGEVTTANVWVFTDMEEKRIIKVSNDHFSIEYSSYDSFKSLKADFENVLDVLREYRDNCTLKRLGIRYIDVIDAGGKTPPLSWGKYISKEYLVTASGKQKPAERQAISRAFNRVEYTYDSMRVVLQYGIHNPDHPAPIKARQYIIDTDVFSLGILEYENIESTLEKFHDKATSVFEGMITDTLRGIMNAE